VTGLLAKEERDRLRRSITRARSVAEEAMRVRLLALGIRTVCDRGHDHAQDCYIWPEDRLRLAADEADLRGRVLSAIEREAVGFAEIQEPEKTRRAAQRYLQGCASTLVNRLAAVRAMEVRGLLAETIVRREKYGGRSQREWRLASSHPSLAPDDLLGLAIDDAFREAAAEIQLLFDLEDPYALLRPDPRALRELLQIFGSEVPEDSWRSDDVLGWVYQFYNEEVRPEARKRFQKTKDANDVPIVNQFYTTPWIVRFLVDNTVGRIWLRMAGDAKAAGVRSICGYLIDRGGGDPEPPSHPREIRVLDPACGSGHFLLYAFDVLWHVWEAFEPGQEPAERAAAILEHNLFGIDIDPRACQIAALGLYLKAKGFAPDVRVKALHVVCADVRLLDGKLRAAFLGRFDGDPDLQAIVQRLLEDLGYTFEFGSLLKVRQPFEKLLAARRGRRGSQARFLVEPAGQVAFTARGSQVAQQRFASGNPSGPAPEVMVIPKDMTFDEIRGALKEFEREALERHDMGGLLFAADAERSLGLLSLLSERYDVVLMNPPYGDMPARCKAYAREHYPRTHSDYYAAFIEQAIDLLKPGGRLGALTGRTFLFLKSHQKLREEILRFDARPEVVLDLGFNVLDGATARYAAFTLRKLSDGEREPWEGHRVLFFRLTPWPWDGKRVHLEEALRTLDRQGQLPPGERVAFEATLGELAEVPGSPFSYWAPKALRDLFLKFPPLDRDVAGRPDQPKIADVKVGLQTSDDDRFVRYWWEVPVDQIATSREETFQGKKWVPFAKGGKPFFYDIQHVVNWGNDGEEIKAYIAERYPYLGGKWEWVVKNESFYFREGVAWARIASTEKLEAWLMPPAVFSVSSLAAFVPEQQLPNIAAYLNSQSATFLLFLLQPLMHDRHIGYVSQLPVSPDVIESLTLASLAREAHDLLRAWRTGDETARAFVAPWVLQVREMLKAGDHETRHPGQGHPLARIFEVSEWEEAKRVWGALAQAQKNGVLEPLVGAGVHWETLLHRRIDEIQGDIDDEVFRLYGISDGDRTLIEAGVAPQPEPGASEEDEGEGGMIAEAEQEAPATGLLSPREHIERLLSFYIREILRSDDDGVVPVTDGFPDTLAPAIWARLEADFGPENRVRIEEELQETLGKSLEDWVYEDYFDLHVRMYRNRPPHWLIQSLPSARRRPAFACLVHYLKITQDTIPRIRMLYARKVLEDAKRRVDLLRRDLETAQGTDDRRAKRLRGQLDEARETVAELEAFDQKLEELTKPQRGPAPRHANWVEEKIWEVRREGYRPNIDYGVLVNITPLREAGILHPAANRVK